MHSRVVNVHQLLCDALTILCRNNIGELQLLYILLTFIMLYYFFRAFVTLTVLFSFLGCLNSLCYQSKVDIRFSFVIPLQDICLYTLLAPK